MNLRLLLTSAAVFFCSGAGAFAGSTAAQQPPVSTAGIDAMDKECYSGSADDEVYVAGKKLGDQQAGKVKVAGVRYVNPKCGHDRMLKERSNAFVANYLVMVNRLDLLEFVMSADPVTLPFTSNLKGFKKATDQQKANKSVTDMLTKSCPGLTANGPKCVKQVEDDFFKDGTCLKTDYPNPPTSSPNDDKRVALESCWKRIHRMTLTAAEETRTVVPANEKAVIELMGDATSARIGQQSGSRTLTNGVAKGLYKDSRPTAAKPSVLIPKSLQFNTPGQGTIYKTKDFDIEKYNPAVARDADSGSGKKTQIEDDKNVDSALDSRGRSVANDKRAQSAYDKDRRDLEQYSGQNQKAVNTASDAVILRQAIDDLDDGYKRSQKGPGPKQGINDIQDRSISITPQYQDYEKTIQNVPVDSLY